METEQIVILALNKLGFSKSSADKRAGLYRNMSAVTTLSRRRKHPSELSNVDIVYVGSRSEGLAIYFDTDIDILFINRNVVCYEGTGTSQADLKNKFSTVFELDLAGVSPGYSRLKLVHQTKKDLGQNTFQGLLNNCLVDKAGQLFLRSDELLDVAKLFLHRATDSNMQKDQTRGPAETYESASSSFSYPVLDLVLAFPCTGTSVMEKWCQRTRPFGWPDNELIKNIKEDCQVLVVPVGHQTDKDAYLQWRISFTQAETMLVRTFTDLELKMFVVLKMIAKEELVSICDNLSSYVMKNVAFWCLEELPLRELGTPSISEYLRLALRYLKVHIEEGFLPNYFIPSRNLLEGRITAQQTEELTAILDQLISEGTEMFLRLQSVKDFTSPDDDNIDQKLKAKEVMEEVRLAGFALPPEQAVAVFEEAEQADSVNKHYDILTGSVFPFIRENDPFGFFKHIRSMTDPELEQFFERI